ncbi:hypothetical protein NHX12_002370, partial [Muraenolepis orangiensis]
SPARLPRQPPPPASTTSLPRQPPPTGLPHWPPPPASPASLPPPASTASLPPPASPARLHRQPPPTSLPRQPPPTSLPPFMGDLDVNLPGMSTTQIKVKLPVCKSIFKEEYHIHITGKWFNYGIIFLVLILDLNMWKNQIFYKPYEYGQYVGPGEKIYTVEEPDTLVLFNRSTLTYAWRSETADPATERSYVERDMFLHSRYVGAGLDVKCLAFVPSLVAFALFGFFVWLLGRFQDSETVPQNQDSTYERIKRKSPSEHSKEMGVTPEEVPAEAPGKDGAPAMLLSVDGRHFGNGGGGGGGGGPSARSASPVSVETTRESTERPESVTIDGPGRGDEAAVSSDLGPPL